MVLGWHVAVDYSRRTEQQQDKLYRKQWTAVLTVRSVQTLTTISVFVSNWCRLHVEVRHRDILARVMQYAVDENRQFILDTLYKACITGNNPTRPRGHHLMPLSLLLQKKKQVHSVLMQTHRGYPPHVYLFVFCLTKTSRFWKLTDTYRFSRCWK